MGFWTFGLAPEAVDNFYSRKVTIYDVYRDETGNISDDGTLDPDIKKIDSTITWMENGVVPKSITLTDYLSNWREDDWIRTTCSDFGEESGQEVQVPTTPSITVCAMLLDYQGNIITGEDLAGTEFKIKLKDRNNHVVSESIFHTPLVHDKRVIATSPNYDAECITYDNLSEQNYSYDQEVITNNGSSLKTPLYNDQFDVQIQDLSDFYQYELNGPNENSNGKIDLRLAEKHRTLVVLNQYNSAIGDENPISAGGVYNNTVLVETDPPPEGDCGIELKDIEEASTSISYSNVGAHATDVDVDGNYAYVSINKTQAGFGIVDIADKQNPVVRSTKNIDNSKGYSVKKDGNYAYVGTSNGYAIVGVSNPYSPTTEKIVKPYTAVYSSEVVGNYLLAVTHSASKALLVYNVTSKTNPSLYKTYTSNDGFHKIVVRGNYAYIGSLYDSSGFRILNISNLANITQTGSLNVGEEVHAIALSGNIAFLGVENGFIKVVNISDPAHPSLVTAVPANTGVNDLTVAGDYLYAAIDTPHGGLYAYNISDPYNPYFVYTLDVGGKGTGIDSDGSYVYVTTDTANKGLTIVGATVTGSATSGDYTSGSFDTESTDTIYDYIEWEATPATGGSIKFQIRTADTIAHLSSATWVGANGTNSTYYEASRTPIVLSADRTGNRYFQYKAFFTSNGVNSPLLDSVHIKYKP